MSTEKKIQKGKLIQKYIGEGIAPFKFTYQGRKGDSWIFEKEFKGVMQTISIYEYRFGKNMISFDLYTDVSGKGIVQAIDIQDVEFNSEMPGFWKYEDEEAFIKILEVMKDILIKKGMRLFKELSVEDEVEATKEMYHELYLHHKELAEKFETENQIEVTAFDKVNIDNWFKVIEGRVQELKKGDYQDAKEELVEMAAFLGEQLVRYRGGEWYHYMAKNHESCSVEYVKSESDSGSNTLHILVGGYAGNGMEWVKCRYGRLLD